MGGRRPPRLAGTHLQPVEFGDRQLREAGREWSCTSWPSAFSEIDLAVEHPRAEHSRSTLELHCIAAGLARGDTPGNRPRHQANLDRAHSRFNDNPRWFSTRPEH